MSIKKVVGRIGEEQMTSDEIRDCLLLSGLDIKDEARLTNGTGVQIRLANGAIVNCYDNGNYNLQGKNQDSVTKALASKIGKVVVVSEKTDVSRKVFVVYGHDTAARTELEAMLRRWGIDPIILDQLPSEGATLIEKLEKYYPHVGFGVVLATPDDEAYPKGKADEIKYRARQNVVLELGLLLAHLGRSKVAILLKDQDIMERPSDIQGLIYFPFKTDLAKEAGLLLAKEMAVQGYNIDVKRV
jgi:predicted nucleotide-binding protein